jgi:hypothetical protein
MEKQFHNHSRKTLVVTKIPLPHYGFERERDFCLVSWWEGSGEVGEI